MEQLERQQFSARSCTVRGSGWATPPSPQGPANTFAWDASAQFWLWVPLRWIRGRPAVGRRGAASSRRPSCPGSPAGHRPGDTARRNEEWLWMRRKQTFRVTFLGSMNSRAYELRYVLTPKRQAPSFFSFKTPDAVPKSACRPPCLSDIVTLNVAAG